MNRRPACHPRLHNRSGVIYVAVLAIATLVMIMAMGALLASRSLLRATTVSNDSDEAAGYAFSAVELARYMIASDSYWRTDYSPGTWFTNKTIGKGSMSCTVSTADSTFSNMTEDITFLGTGYKGTTIQKLKAVVHSAITPLTCISSVISVGGAVTISSATISAATAGLSGNSTVSASGSTVGLAVNAVSTVSGSYYQQQVLAGQTAVTFPTTAWMNSTSPYMSSGTTINYSAITGATIQKVVLSPGNNPYGSTNTKGIYIINCGGKNLTIQNCRIVGTLLVLNCATLQINSSVNWVPAVTDYPTLMGQCTTLLLSMSSTSLLENSTDKVSYNAPGTPYPYPSGTTNSTYTDSFPSVISGLMYVTGNAQLSGSNSIGILIVSGTCSITGTVSPTYDTTYYSNPPPCFYNNTLSTDANTYARSVN
jgi:hypothetical protein